MAWGWVFGVCCACGAGRGGGRRGCGRGARGLRCHALASMEPCSACLSDLYGGGRTARLEGLVGAGGRCSGGQAHCVTYNDRAVGQHWHKGGGACHARLRSARMQHGGCTPFCEPCSSRPHVGRPHAGGQLAWPQRRALQCVRLLPSWFSSVACVPKLRPCGEPLCCKPT